LICAVAGVVAVEKDIRRRRSVVNLHIEVRRDFVSIVDTSPVFLPVNGSAITMAKPYKMLGNIIKYDVLIEYEPEEIRLWGVRFLRNFGPWQEGDYCEYLWVDYELGRMVEQTKDMKEVKSCELKLEVRV
jgi:hypothetical protein